MLTRFTVVVSFIVPFLPLLVLGLLSMYLDGRMISL